MTELRLQPSVLDRLNPIASTVRWWTSQITALFGSPARKMVSVDDIESSKKRLPSKVTVVLGETDGFAATARLPKGAADAHRQALGLKIQDLAPALPQALCIVASAAARAPDGSLTYSVAMARKDRLTELEQAAQRKGAQSVAFVVEQAQDVELRSPNTEHKARRNLFIDTLIILGVIVATMIAVSVWTAHIQTETERLAAEERSLRRAAVAAEAARNDANVSAQLVERGLMSRRADTALRTLAILNEATPNTAWWTRIRWTPLETTLSGQAGDATAAIKQISDAAKAWSIELTGPLNAAPSGSYQSFEIIARERKTVAP